MERTEQEYQEKERALLIAELERQRAEYLAAKLRELGVDVEA